MEMEMEIKMKINEDKQCISVIENIFKENNKPNFRNTFLPINETNLLNLCGSLDFNVYINFKYFKYMATKETYPILLQYIVNNLKNILKTYECFNVHLCLKSLTPAQLSTHYNFIKSSCEIFKNEFPDKLNICYVYDAPFIFSQLYDIISIFIDKKTKQKIITI